MSYRTKEELEVDRAMSQANTFISVVIVVLIIALAVCFLLLP